MYCILFDCDGTIVDSEALIVRAMQIAFEDVFLLQLLFRHHSRQFQSTLAQVD